MTQDAPIAADSVRAALRTVFSGPQYVWDRPRDPWAWLRELFASLQRWLAALHEEHVVLYWLLVVALLLVLGAILAHVGVLVYRALRARPMAAPQRATATGERHDAAWFAREALRLELAGRYAESLAMRFASLVHALDERKLLRVHASRTPMEYVRESSLDPERRSAFASLVRDYYRYLFGRAPLDRAALAAFDQQAAALTSRG